MKTEFLARSPLLILPLGALFFFLLVFATVVITTMLRKATAYDPLARMPLDGEEPGGQS